MGMCRLVWLLKAIKVFCFAVFACVIVLLRVESLSPSVITLYTEPPPWCIMEGPNVKYWMEWDGVITAERW